MLNAVLPMLWAILAAAIGFALYRTRSALFDENARQAKRTRRIRGTGSAAIAGLPYMRMGYATNQLTYSETRREMNAAYTHAAAVDRFALEALAGVSSNNPEDAKISLLRLREENAKIIEALRER